MTEQELQQMKELDCEKFYTYAGTPGQRDASYIEVVALPSDAWVYRHNAPDIDTDWVVTYCPADVVNEWQEWYDELTAYQEETCVTEL